MIIDILTLHIFCLVSVVSGCTYFSSGSTDIVSIHVYPVCISHVISVSYSETFDQDGHKIVSNLPLNHAPLEKEPEFELSKENPRIYKADIGYSPAKEWEEPLPTISEDQPPVSTIDPEKVRMCQQVHDLQVEILGAMGVDACREYEQSKVEFIIEAVQANDSSCPLCKKPLKDGAAVRTHLRAKHMGATPFVCDTCKKSFGDSQLLKSHQKTHTDVNKFMCPQVGCGRGYPTKGRLNQHLKIHDASKHVACRYCGKVFNSKKNVGPYEKTCEKNPTSAVKDKQCKFCPKAFFHMKDLKYHVQHQHKSRAGKKS